MVILVAKTQQNADSVLFGVVYLALHKKEAYTSVIGCRNVI
jgi:hypothetical protein